MLLMLCSQFPNLGFPKHSLQQALRASLIESSAHINLMGEYTYDYRMLNPTALVVAVVAVAPDLAPSESASTA